jgi:16S rRNA (cytidine1402-2'-O)-methyltransferase
MTQQTPTRGTLYIVSTDIGHPDDVTARAKEILETCDVVLCEDLKPARALLHRFGLQKELLPLNEHTTSTATNEALDLLRGGKTLALISDCGTPLLADPGTELVARAVGDGFEVRPIPGASSILAALVVSGFGVTQFTMAGFLPRDKNERKKAAAAYRNRTETLVFLEAPYRLNQLLGDLTEGLDSDRPAALAMDLTLPKERVRRDTLLGLKKYFEEHPFKGEFVLVVQGRSNASAKKNIRGASNKSRTRI